MIRVANMFLQYLIKKILIFVMSLFCVTTITFFLMHAIPGDPFIQEQAIPPEILEGLYSYYGLDKPLLSQYFTYLTQLLQGDFGPSFKYEGRSVTSLIFESFPVSFALGIQALFVAIGGGVAIGMFAAMRRESAFDRAIMFFAVLFISVPNFILATALQYLFSVKLGWFPVARWGSFAHTILPTLSLAALPMAYIARLLRGSILDVLDEDYVLTAKAKGLTPLQVMFKHVLKNSILPVVTYIGPFASSILTGSFIVEKIFGIPGLGNWFVSSITNRDYTVIMGVTIFYSFILLFTVLLVDLLYPLLDPRIKLRGEVQ